MSRNGTECAIEVENVFGPVVSSTCLDGFDFTLLFEESILAILPLVIAAIWCIFRLFTLRHECSKVRASWLLACKMVTYATYTGLQITLFGLWAAGDAPTTRLTLLCVSLTILMSILLSMLSYVEHTRSLRPSTMVIAFLGTSLLLDLARVRTLFFIPRMQTIARLFLAGFCIKSLTLGLEVTEKRRLLRESWKHASPEATSSTINRAMFIWLNSVFVRGFRSLLTIDTLMPLDDEILSASKPTELMNEWRKAAKSDHALFWLFAKHYKRAILAGVLPRLAYAAFNFSQPYLVQKVLDYTAEPEETKRTDFAYGLLGAYAIVYIGLALSYSVYQHKTYRLLTLYRGSLVAMIFEKTLAVDSSSLDNADAITLMSADIDRITSSMHLVHELYASVIEAGVALYLLYDFLGIAMLASIGWIIICLLAGVPIARASGNAQVPWLEAIEERLAATAKALGCMKAIKMTGFANIVSDQIAGLRTAEIRASRRHRILSIFVFVTSFASSTLAPIWGFMAYILIAKARGTGTLTEGVAFATLSLFELLNQPMMYVIDGMEDIQTVLNSFRRIQDYLLSPERNEYRNPLPSSEASIASRSDAETQVSCPYGLACDCSGAEFAASVTGAAASYDEDADSVLHDVNMQVPWHEITMIHGPVGSGKSTLLKLVLGEMPFVTGLTCTSFPEAAYCPQSPWCSWGSVRDNILGQSEMDEKWYNTVISACGLVEDFHAFPMGDQTHTGTRGSRLSGGQQIRVSLARSLYSRRPVIILDDVVTGLDRNTEKKVLNEVFGPHGILRKLNSTVIWATSSMHHLHFADNITLLSQDGTVSRQGPRDDFDLDVADQPAETPKNAETEQPFELPDELQQLEIEEEIEFTHHSKAGDWKIYGYYANIAGWWLMLIYVFAIAVFVFGVTFPSVWIQWWTNANATRPNERLGYWIGTLVGLGMLTLAGCFIADCTFNLVVLPKTSRRFHELLLNTTMRAKTSFLTSADSGKIVNRFSQDLELIDNDLPQSIDKTIFQFMSTIVTAAFVFMGSSYVAAAIPLCILAVYIVQYYYLRTSRQMRLLDIEAKAPLFSHFLKTIQGIVPIRAYGWTQQYKEKCHEELNRSQRPYYLLFCIQRWLTLVLDLLNAGVAIVLVAVVTNIHSGSTEYLGVALFSIVTFSSTLQTLVQEWTQVETALGAINRIRAFVKNVDDENLPGENQDVPDAWPADGNISIEGISASYKSSDEQALKDVTVSIEAGQKVAICGRTGSGKSSLISTLIRMMEVDNGRILIDGLDISTLPRQEVRQRLVTLPQEPFFLEGSVRYNLDPAQSANDDLLEEILREVGLWELFESREGLDGELRDDTLSHGQRQLLCLARAAVKPGKIVIIDEATSSVDSQTEELMQRFLRKQFSDRTIIAVAHKLQSILDFDLVILMESGRAIEIGRPQELLAMETSAFRALYERRPQANEHE